MNTASPNQPHLIDISPQTAEELKKCLPAEEREQLTLFLDYPLPAWEEVKNAPESQSFMMPAIRNGQRVAVQLPRNLMLEMLRQVDTAVKQRTWMTPYQSSTVSTVTLNRGPDIKDNLDADALPTTQQRRRPNAPFYDRFRRKSRGGYG